MCVCVCVIYCFVCLLQIDSGVIKKTSGLGVGVSTLASQEEDLTDDQKTIFDWCKEGNMDRVTTLLTRQKSDVDINKTDENVGECKI